MSIPSQTRDSRAMGAAVVFLVVGTVAGFFLGRLTAPASEESMKKSSRNVSNLPSSSKPKQAISGSAVDSEDEGDQDLQSFEGRHEECKLILVVRTDLGMTKGKIAAQCSHATLACYKALARQEAKSSRPSSSILHRWESLGQAKIAVQVKSEEELFVLQAQAISLGLCAKVIHDAGRTQIASGSATVLGIGPGPKSVVNEVTGSLKLL